MPFGLHRSHFNTRLKSSLISLKDKINYINFTSIDFKTFNYDMLSKNDFLYADPPYLIADASYNKQWSILDEKILYTILDELNRRRIKWALSNVTHHKNKINHLLIDWAANYNIHHIDVSYNNCNYHKKDKESLTREVLITNY